MLDFIRRNRKKIFFILAIVIAIILSVPAVFLKKTPEIGSLSRLEIVALAFQIFAAVFAIAGTFIAVSQYYISSQSEVINLEENRVDRALKLAEFYKDNILKEYSAIRKIYKESGIFDIMHKYRNKMEQFDCEEMEEIIVSEDLKKIREIKSSADFQIKLIALDLMERGVDISNSMVLDENNDKLEISIVDAEKNVSLSNRCIFNLANNMELFSMYFSHNIADESVVYQSLYPTYIEMCRTLYFDISSCSSKGGPKLYRNVQYLYNKWNEKTNFKSQGIRRQQNDLGKIAGNIKK